MAGRGFEEKEGVGDLKREQKFKREGDTSDLGKATVADSNFS